MFEQDHRLSWTQSFQAESRGAAVNDAGTVLLKQYPNRTVFIEEFTVWGPFSPYMRKEAMSLKNGKVFLGPTDYVRGVYDVNIRYTLGEA